MNTSDAAPSPSSSTSAPAPAPAVPLPPKVWTCVTCCEEQTGKHLSIDGSEICNPCFRHLFELACESESDFPARWGDKPLPKKNYVHILGPDLLALYAAKEREFSCPLPERVFCQQTEPPRRAGPPPQPCGVFLGRWVNRKTCVRCEKCTWYSCLRCEECFSISDAGNAAKLRITHDCDPHRDSEFDERAFGNLKRGKDYQICPNENCKRKVELTSGCNKMRCQCRTAFCFLCGKHVQDGEWHWRPGSGCPRWGQPDSERAIYDDHGAGGEEMADNDLARMLQFAGGLGWANQFAPLRDTFRALDMQMQMVEEAAAEARRDEDLRQWNMREAARLLRGAVGQRESGGERERDEAPPETERRQERHHERHRPRHTVHRDGIHRRRHRSPSPRRHSGLRDFIAEVVEGTGQALFGQPHNDRSRTRGRV